MTTNSQEEMESQEGTDNFDKEPGGGFELRKRQVVECAKETIENGTYLCNLVGVTIHLVDRFHY